MPLPSGKRSMADADKAANKRFVIGGTIVLIAVMAIVYVIPNDVHSFFLVTKSWTKWLSLVGFLICGVMLYKAHSVTIGEKYGHMYWIALGIILVLSIATACGFDFSYFRLR